jgi:hypothetical protein
MLIIAPEKPRVFRHPPLEESVGLHPAEMTAVREMMYDETMNPIM